MDSKAGHEKTLVFELSTHTHSALRPAAFEGEAEETRAMPGITFRDVRMAMLLDVIAEDILTEK